MATNDTTSRRLAEPPIWFPLDWLTWPGDSHEDTEEDPVPADTAPEAGPQQLPSASSTTLRENENGNGNDFQRIERVVVVRPNRDRTVNRKLRGIHMFMISINATVGTGLYWRGGQILELGGPLAVLLSFVIVGFIAWSVMQCITEMLCIWPIPGAFSVYVSEFVDAELGIVVGVAYWFTYSVSFSALLSTIAAEVQYWTRDKDEFDADSFNAGVVYVLLPLIMVAVNSFGVEIYGLIEVVSGVIKIFFYFIIAIVLVAINAGVGGYPKDGDAIGIQYWEHPTEYDEKASDSWAGCFLMSVSIAAFAYVGVEIVAASSLEARPRKKDVSMTSSGADLLIGKTVKFSSSYIPVVVAVAYTVAGVLVSFDIHRADCILPRVSWLKHTYDCPETDHDISAFVTIAEKARIPHMNQAFNTFLVFTALTCANTNLYVASRSLFGLTSRLDGGPYQPWYLRVLAWFGRTNGQKVPLRAMVFSAVAFWWVPFLELQHEDGISVFVEVLASMGSVGVQIVWACECLAFIRYYHCIRRHREFLETHKVSQVRRWDQDDYHDYPYRSHAQPFLAYIAFAGCIFLLIVSNSAPLWKGLHAEPFLSSYLIVFAFTTFWVILKVFRGAKWQLVDLTNPERVTNKIRTLHDIRLGAS